MKGARTLDLRPFGVDLDPEWLEAFVDELEIPAYVPDTDEIEIYQVVEDRDFHEAVFRCGYRAIRCFQWHHEFDEEPVDCWFVCCE